MRPINTIVTDVFFAIAFVAGLFFLAGLPSVSFAATTLNGCIELTAADTYELGASLSGANVSVSGGSACIWIDASDIILDCKGYNIVNDGTASAMGVFVNTTLNNITIRNCPYIANYGVDAQSYGIYFDYGPMSSYVTNVTITNNTFVNDSIGIYSPRGDTFTVDTSYSYNASVDAITPYGFRFGVSTSSLSMMNNLNMTNMIVDNSSWNCFDVFATNVYINNITGTNCTNYGLNFAGPLSGTTSSNVTVTNSRFSTAAARAISISGGSGTSLITNITLQNVSASMSPTGLYAKWVKLAQFLNTSVYSNSQYGVMFSDANVSGASFTLYGNGLDFYATDAVSGITPTMNVSATFLPPSGVYQNYTNLSFTDTMSEGDMYTMNWSSELVSLPSGDYSSFAYKFLNITAVAGAPSIDVITWYWLESELSGYTETTFEVWKYNETWTRVTGGPDTTNNLFNFTDLVPDTSIYGVLQYTPASDTIYPRITMVRPQNTTYNTNLSLSLNYTVSDETNISTCRYLLDGSVLVQMSSCGNTTFNVSSNVEGPHNITVYVNDTSNNTNSSTVYFTIDLTYPTLSILYPANTTYSYNESLPLNFSVSDARLSHCWYSVDSGTNSTASTACANATINVTGEGSHNVTVYVNDTANNVNSSRRYFSVDKYPTISIVTPSNSTYASSTISFTYSVADYIGVSSCWYRLNSGTNTTLTSCANSTLTSLANGAYNLTIYVNDTSNNINQSSVYFTVDLSTDTDSPSRSSDDLSASLSTDACDGNLLEVDAGKGVEVVVINDDTLTDIASGTTDSDGHFTFSGCGIDVRITLKKSGYSTYKFVETLAACEVCIAGCTKDAECLSDERCSAGTCVPVSCSCGEVLDHSCVRYDCCSDSDCSSEESCMSHACVKSQCDSDSACANSEYCSIETGATKGTCKAVTGCGSVENHILVPYECGDDATCPVCASGSTCINNKCVASNPQTAITGPPSAYINDTVKVTVTTGSSKCAMCDVQITDPSGKHSSGKTDAQGGLDFKPSLVGKYEIAVLKGGSVAASKSVNVLPKANPASNQTPAKTAVIGSDLVFPIAIILVLGAICLLAIYLTRKKRK